MKRLYTTIVMAAALGGVAMAQDALPIASGETAESNELYVFEAPSAGTLRISSNTVLQFELSLYRNADLTNAVRYEAMVPGETGIDYYFSVEKGADYYFYFPYVQVGDQGPRFKFNFAEGGIPNDVSSVIPLPTTKVAYNLASAPFVELSFVSGEAFSCSESLLCYETKEGAQASTPIYYEGVYKGYYMAYEVKLREAIAAVKADMKDGCDMTILMRKPTVGGKSVEGPSQWLNSDGDISLTYRYAAQTSIVEEVVPDPFLTYWAEGNEDGIMKFVFDGPLAPMEEQNNAELHIFAGPYVDGGEDSSWPELPGAPMEIEGNTLTVDLCGVHRNTTFSTVTVIISGLVAKDGLSIDYHGSGAIGVYDIPYKKLSQGDLVYELTPASGSLEGVASIEFFAYPDVFDHVRIDGFRFETDDMEPVELTAEECNPQEDSLLPGAVVYNVPVSETLQATQNLTFTVELTPLDGYSYSIKAVYNKAEGSSVATVAPAEDETIYFDLQGRRVLNPGRGIYVTTSGTILKR